MTTEENETPETLRVEADRLRTAAQRLEEKAAQMELSATEAANYARSHAAPQAAAKTEE